MSSRGWSPYATQYDPVKIASIDATDVIAHDHGVVRALSAVYRSKAPNGSKANLTLFVGRLHGDVTQEDLEKLFAQYGSLTRVTLIRDIVTGFSKQYGFVEFEDEPCCQRARRKTNGTVFMGKAIIVDYECQRSMQGWVPRRLGGGFGGRKESGQLRFGCVDRPWKKPISLYAELQQRPTEGNSRGCDEHRHSRKRSRERDDDERKSRDYNKRHKSPISKHEKSRQRDDAERKVRPKRETSGKYETDRQRDTADARKPRDYTKRGASPVRRHERSRDSDDRQHSRRY